MNRKNPWASRKDGNAKELDAALLARGFSVLVLDMIGKGCPDRLVGGQHANGQRLNVLIEYKNDYDYPTTKRGKPYVERVRGKLNPDQEKWHREWLGLPVEVVRTIAEAFHVFGLE